MEPPVKRRRLGEVCEKRHEPKVGDEWEEYDGDDDTEAAPGEHKKQNKQKQQHRSAIQQMYGHQPLVEKACVATRSPTAKVQSSQRLGCESESTSNDIKNSTGGVHFKDGHIKNLRHEVGEKVDDGEQALLVKGVDGDGNGDGNDDEDEDEGEDETGSGDDDEDGEDDGILPKYSSGDRIPQVDPQDANGSYDESRTTTENQPWRTDGHDVDVLPDYMQFQGSYPDPDSVDSIPGYSHGLVADDGPSLISGLYDGGGLRYASSIGPYGASPFALGPWEMLPQVREAYGAPDLTGLSPPRPSDYRYREQPTMRTLSSWTSPNSIRHTAAYTSDESGAAGQSANLFEQHPEEAASAHITEDNPAASPGRGGRHGRARSSLRLAKHWQPEVIEDSDTLEDAIFSAEEIEASSQTGDDTLPSKQAHKSYTSDRVIPDSQETLPFQEDDAVAPVAATSRASYNKPSHKDFDLACMLSDDETPLFSVSSGAATTGGVKKVAGPVAKFSNIGTPAISSDGVPVKRGRGRPRKYDRPDDRNGKLRSAPKKTRRSPRAAPTPTLSGPQINTCNGSIPTQPTPWASHISNTSLNTTAAQGPGADPDSRTEVVFKRKRGRPRKSEQSQQQAQHQAQQKAQQQAQQQQQQAQQQAQNQAQQHYMHFPPHMFGHPYYFPPYQFGFPPQAYHPFQSMMQQPFQPYPAPVAYPPLQNTFLPQSAVPLQHQSMHQPMHPLLQQPPAQRPPVPTDENGEPIKRKRGRPRKYPVGYKRSRRKVKAQNGMTAILSGNAVKFPATEDAWYGVARRLAQDISSLQGGYLLSNGFQMQAQTAYEPSGKGPQSQPEEQCPDAESSEFSSEEELEPHDSGRIMEVLDTADEEPSPKPVPGGASQADGPEISESFESSKAPNCEEGPESPRSLMPPSSPSSSASPRSFANDDDAGFMEFPESPKSVAKSAGPTPSPPSPPLSARGSSRSMREKLVASTPTPKRTASDRTPTPLQFLKSRTPVSHNSDAFGLPSSPMSSSKRSDMSLIARFERTTLSKGPDDDRLEPDVENLELGRSADVELSDPEEELVLAVEDDVSTTVVREEEHHQVEPLAEVQPLPPNTPAGRSSSAPAAPVSLTTPTKAPRTPMSKISPGTHTPRRTSTPRSPAQMAANHAKALDPLQPEAAEAPSSGVRTRTASPSLFIPSPAQAAPKTPEKKTMQPLAAAIPPKSPLHRAMIAPRSAERCTPIFLDIKRAPSKLPSLTETRTMGELKQAIIAPSLRSQESRSQGPKQMSLKSMFSQLTSDDSIARQKDHSRPPSLQTSQVRRSSSLQSQGAKPVISASMSTKSRTPGSDIVKDKKRQKSRRSLLSLVSGNAKGQEAEYDDEDELGSPYQSHSSSSKPARAQPSAASKSTAVAADSSAHHKIRKSVSRTAAEASVELDRERPKHDEKKRRKDKKKRRHTEGSVLEHRSGKSAAVGGSAVQECGVDGYRCNRDFCFTCL
ncbi:hypothetical protein E4U36_001420 [Claviceps purpurea]|nr:hypothetical protein E4U51_007883 [Claviceps purpurea]KAG6185307.1 hypothetical protein E4U36_001420 [Claviceps purpurea]